MMPYKSKWNGKLVLDGADTGDAYFIVLRPVSVVNPAVLEKLSRILETPVREMNIRVRPDGFIVLSSGTNEAEMLDKAHRMRAEGFQALVFKDSELFDVPRANVVHTGIFNENENEIELYSLDGTKLLIISHGDNLLMVNARIDKSAVMSSLSSAGRSAIAAGVNRGFDAGISMMGDAMKTSVTSKSEKSGVLDIYNFSDNLCVRIIEGKFNFRTLFADETEYSYIANARKLITLAVKITDSAFPDSFYEKSNLPYTASVMHVETKDVGVNGAITVRAERDDMERFSNYSHFRYIVEIFGNDENGYVKAQL